MLTDLGIGFWLIGMGVTKLPVTNGGLAGGIVMIFGGMLYLVGTIGPAV